MNISELTNIEARKVLLNATSYSTIELPAYFDFQNLLDKLQKLYEEDRINFCNYRQAKDIDKVNYNFYQNKDGNLSWRKLQLINPAIYVLLVNEITNDSNWSQIQKVLNQQDSYHIKCNSIPIVNNNIVRKSDTIQNWWSSVEQESIIKSLRYNWLAITDITDCYGSIYTHSISWAILGINEAKKSKGNDLFPNNIDSILRAMSYGQTNGIPQGSLIMDLLAEVILCATDKILKESIINEGIEDFQIIRYRDDYRIYTKNQEDVIKILKILNDTLLVFNFKLNNQKTFMSSNLITDSIKIDKLYWNELNQELNDKKSLQRHLLLIHKLATNHANSGSIKTALTDFFEEVSNAPERVLNENTMVLISIIVDIVVKNPNCYSIGIIGLGLLFKYLNNDQIKQILEIIEEKIKIIPHNSFLKIWIQRLTIKKNIVFSLCNDEILCKIASSKSGANKNLWSLKWLNNKKVKDAIESTPIINKMRLQELPEIPLLDELKVFHNIY